MKKTILSILLAVMTVGLSAVFTSCSDDNDEQGDKSNIETPEEKISNYAGVWESVDDDMFFLAISEEGNVNYCLNDYLIGRGDGYIKDNTIIINNSYSSFTDKLKLNKIEDTQISIRGKINRAKGDGIEDVNIVLTKTKEPFVNSFRGQFWKSMTLLSAIYGDVQRTMSFISDDYLQYKYYVKNTGKTIKEELWYYIPRKHHKKGDLIYIHSSSERTSLIETYMGSIYQK